MSTAPLLPPGPVTPGVRTSKGLIYASIVGFVRQTRRGSEIAVACLEVVPQLTAADSATTVPSVGQAVWARVTRLTPKAVYVDILMADPPTSVYVDPFKGEIRYVLLRRWKLIVPF